MIACPELETFTLLLRDELLAPLREQVEAHVEKCEVCRMKIDWLKRESALKKDSDPRHDEELPKKFLTTDSFLTNISDRGNLRFPTPASAPTHGLGWPKVDGYEILGELGAGGMSHVYRALHLGLAREVALKVIRFGPSTEMLRGRLEQEAIALARLRHPNIVQVYDIGASNGQAYLALELIEGTTLSAWLQGMPQPPEVAAHLTRVLAQAIDYAHRNGILHRDLKPANVLVESPANDPPDRGAQAEPPKIKVTDFGLAKGIAEGDFLVGGLTKTGDVLGTPAYMAPEQANGLRSPVGPGADVYALGVILYELLVGHPPFYGGSYLGILNQVVHEAPPSLSRFQPRTPVDLATICMKCLEKSPSGRYHSAGALAEDLRRFLAREPIVARPAGPVEKLVRWGQRKPRLAAAVAAAVAGTALAFSLVFWQWRTAEAARARAEEARLESERAAVGLLLDESLAIYERGAVLTGKRWLAQAQQRAEELGLQDIVEACRANMACWSGRMKLVSISPPLGTVIDSSYSSDGRRILVILRPEDGKAVGPDVARLWDPEGWKPIGPALAHGGSVTSIAFSPDGRFALTGAIDGSVRLWDSAAGEPAGPMLRGLESVTSVAFHPDGKRFGAGGASRGGRGEACIWGVAAGGEPAATYPLASPADAIAFSPDGALLATASRVSGTADESRQEEVCQWNLATKERQGPRLMHSAAVRALAYSPDGRILATGGDERVVILWDRATSERTGQPLTHPVEIRSIAFTADGKTLGVVGGGIGPSDATSPSARREASVRFWDVDTRKLHAGLTVPDLTQAFSPGPGRRLMITGLGGLIAIFEANFGAVAKQALPLSCTALAFMLDDRVLIAAGGEHDSAGGRIQALDPESGRALRPPIQFPSKVIEVAIAPAGDAYAVALADGTVRAFDPRDDRPLGPALEHPGTARSLAFSDDGMRLLATVPGVTSRLWDWRRGGIVWSSSSGDVPRAAAFSPDGRMMLIAREGGGLVLLDLAGEGPAQEIWEGPPVQFTCAAFSPDGRLALAGDNKGVARCWEIATRRMSETAIDFTVGSEVVRVGFTGTGSRSYILGCNREVDLGLVFVWDPLSGASSKQLRYRINFRAVAFRPGDRLIATAGRTGGACLWDAATGHKIGPELSEIGDISAIATSRDGRSVAVIDEKNALKLWRIPLPGPVSPAK